MDFLLGAGVLLIGVIMGAAICRASREGLSKFKPSNFPTDKD